MKVHPTASHGYIQQFHSRVSIQTGFEKMSISSSVGLRNFNPKLRVCLLQFFPGSQPILFHIYDAF